MVFRPPEPIYGWIHEKSGVHGISIHVCRDGVKKAEKEGPEGARAMQSTEEVQEME